MTRTLGSWFRKLLGTFLLLVLQVTLWNGVLTQFQNAQPTSLQSFGALWGYLQMVAQGTFLSIIPLAVMLALWTGVVPLITGRSRVGCSVLVLAIGLVALTLTAALAGF